MNKEPVRVLIVSTTMDRGGAETLVMNVFRKLDRTRVMFDFVLHCNYRSAYEDEIESLGGIIYRLPFFRVYNEHSYRRAFREFFKAHPEYKTVHAHIDNSASVFLDEANRCGLHTIAHSHCTSNGKGPRAWIRNFYRKNLYRIAEYRFACSEDAGVWLYRNRAPFTVIRNGIDTEKFRYNDQARSEIRKELNIPENAVVLGHVGRFDPVKNHVFILQVFEELLKKHPDAYLVLAGDGPTMQGAVDAAKHAGLTDRVIFTGSRQDVYRLYSAFDVFVFPSIHEGLPLTLIEAQCSGLPCVVSSHLTDEFEITNLIKRVDLSLSPDVWAQNVESCLSAARTDNACVVAEKGYDIGFTARQLQDFYIKLDSMKRIAGVSLSFDDGRADNFEALKGICGPMHIPATVNITTGYLDGTAPLMPTSKPALSLDELKELYDDPLVEIALHGDNHDNGIEEQKKCYEKLQSRIGFSDDSHLGFASPGCGDESLFYKTDDPFVRKVIYARSGDRVLGRRFLKTLARKASRVIPSSLLYRFAFSDSLLCADDYNRRLLFSVLVLNKTAPSQVRSLVRLAVKKNRDLILCFHSIDNDSDKWSWGPEKFRNLCSFLAKLRDEGRIELYSTAQLVENRTTEITDAP